MDIRSYSSKLFFEVGMCFIAYKQFLFSVSCHRTFNILCPVIDVPVMQNLLTEILMEVVKANTVGREIVSLGRRKIEEKMF